MGVFVDGEQVSGGGTPSGPASNFLAGTYPGPSANTANTAGNAILKGLLTTAGDLVGASAANTPARVVPAALGTVLTSNGAGVAATFQASGGIPASLLTTRGQMIRAGAAGAVQAFAAQVANTFVGGDGTDAVARTAAQVRTSIGVANRAAVPGKTPVLWWKCDELSGVTLANSGSAASGDLTAGAALRVGYTSAWPDRVIDSVDNANSVATGAPAVEPATYTVMGTFILRTYPAGYGIGLYKMANLASALAPVWSVGGFGFNSSADGRVIAGVTIGGVNILATSGTGDRAALGVRQHLASAFDGTTLRLYLNGNEVATAAAVGAVDYAANGRWSLANFDPATAVGNLATTGQILDARIFDSVLTPAEIRAVALAALGD
jgi:hypothetical protein